MSAHVKGPAGDDVKVECDNQAEEWPIRKNRGGDQEGNENRARVKIGS